MSRFISGGTNETPTERDEAWVEAQQKIEAAKQQQKIEMGRGGQADGKSLYETLQANKAAKQDAFEESLRLRNQFRSLDEDEVEFLDSVLASTREREAAVQRETSDQLETFRRRKEALEKTHSTTSSGVQGSALQSSISSTGDGIEGNGSAVAETGESESWSVTAGSRKRRKLLRDGLVGGVKIRRTSSSSTPGTAAAAASSDPTSTSPSNATLKDGSELPNANSRGKDEELKIGSRSTEQQDQHPPISSIGTTSAENKVSLASFTEKTNTATKPPPPPSSSPPALGLGLGAYSSDDDDD